MCLLGFLIIIAHMNMVFLCNRLKLLLEVKFRTAASDINVNSYGPALSYLENTSDKIFHWFLYQYYRL